MLASAHDKMYWRGLYFAVVHEEITRVWVAALAPTAGGRVKVPLVNAAIPTIISGLGFIYARVLRVGDESESVSQELRRQASRIGLIARPV